MLPGTMRYLSRVTLLLCFAAAGEASVLYSVTNLGLFPGGSFTSATGLSSNGFVTGYGDSLLNLGQAFLWNGTLTNVGPPASPLAFGNAVNASGEVAGYAFLSDFSAYYAFLYTGSNIVTIPTLGGADNQANGINDSGTVVGFSEDANGIPQAFEYSGGTVTQIGTLPGGTTSQATGINDLGQIVGFSDAADGLTHAFLYSGGAFTDLGIPTGFNSSQATSIGEFGAVTGYVQTSTLINQAFIWTPTSGMTLLGTLGDNSQAFGINGSNDVVGTANGDAFLYTGSLAQFNLADMYDLNTLLNASGAGWQLQQALAINDRGQIVGTGLYDGNQAAFLLNAVVTAQSPEPGTWCLAAAGLAIVGYRLRKHRFERF